VCVCVCVCVSVSVCVCVSVSLLAYFCGALRPFSQRTWPVDRMPSHACTTPPTISMQVHEFLSFFLPFFLSPVPKPSFLSYSSFCFTSLLVSSRDVTGLYSRGGFTCTATLEVRGKNREMERRKR
jgi:hypothetical protein